MTVIIGIDPGEKGGIAVLHYNKLVTYNMPGTYPDIYRLLESIKKEAPDSKVILERVALGLPGQSSSATAKFARHNGHIEMALYALGFPTEEVTPQKWMKHYSNQTGSSKGLTKTQWKNKLKSLAQALYPNNTITLNTADAVLLAHYEISK